MTRGEKKKKKNANSCFSDISHKPNSILLLLNEMLKKKKKKKKKKNSRFGFFFLPNYYYLILFIYLFIFCTDEVGKENYSD